MGKYKVIQILALMLAFWATEVSAEGVSFTARAPRQVVQGNRFSVAYTLRNGEGSGFAAPEIEGATKIYGRQCRHPIANNG